MGFFSWKTNDTNKSIGNIYGDLAMVRTVYMKDNQGGVWKEDAYEGYGVFGGKDFYELVAEMNGLKTRDEGILLSRRTTTPESLVNKITDGQWDSQPDRLTVDPVTFLQKRVKAIFPNLVEDINTEWKNEEPETCEYQGFFYPEEVS